MSEFKRQYTSEIVRNRRLYEYFFNGREEMLEIKINKRTVGFAIGDKAVRIWKKLMDC